MTCTEFMQRLRIEDIKELRNVIDTLNTIKVDIPGFGKLIEMHASNDADEPIVIEDIMPIYDGIVPVFIKKGHRNLNVIFKLRVTNYKFAISVHIDNNAEYPENWVDGAFTIEEFLDVINGIILDNDAKTNPSKYMPTSDDLEFVNKRLNEIGYYMKEHNLHIINEGNDAWYLVPMEVNNWEEGKRMKSSLANEIYDKCSVSIITENSVCNGALYL